MSERLTIDSSVFLSAWNQGETLHRISVLFFEELVARPVSILLPELALFELTNALTRVGMQEKISTYMSILTSDDIELIPLFPDLYPVFSQLSPLVHLKSADLIFCALAHLNKTTLVSWDRHLIKQARTVIPAYTPREYLQQINH